MDGKTKDIFNELKSKTDEVIVSYSGGKDSLVLLDLCTKVFSKVHAFYMYIVKDISFQMRMLDYAEKKYKIEIKYYPHWLLSRWYKNNTYRLPDSNTFDIKNLNINDIEQTARNYFNTDMVLTGIKQADSIDRRIYLRTLKLSAINEKGQKAHPLSFWNKGMVMSYIKRFKLPTPENFGLNSFDIELVPNKIIPIKNKYPEDYEKIKQQFPLIDSLLVYEKIRKE